MSSCGHIEVSGIILGFPRLSPRGGQVAHVLLSRSPLYTHLKGALTVRLACVRRAASVHPEPGSNSPFKIKLTKSQYNLKLSWIHVSKIPLISDSLKLWIDYWTKCSNSNFACLSLLIFRSQYPVFKVRCAAISHCVVRGAGNNYTHLRLVCEEDFVSS